MEQHNRWKVFGGPLLLLFVSYLIYFIRYPIWGWNAEPVFVALSSSYAIILVVALVLLKKDLNKSLLAFFRFHGFRLIAVSLLLAVLFQALWYGVALGLGSTIQVTSFPVLRGYELYSYSSLLLAFALYLAFAVFGAFAEEVAYRGYVQTRIQSKYGVAAGIVVSAIFFSLQHIHVFQLSWIEGFFQGQFINVFLGGLFLGYLYHKGKGDIWSVFAFHVVGNVLSVALPIQIVYPFAYAGWISTIVTYAALFLILWVCLRGKHILFQRCQK